LPPAPASAASGGLPAATQARFAPLFGMDLSSVRVHEGGEAQGWGAIAAARGDDLHFSPGSYQPGTPAGDELIAHELAHVHQQRAGRVSGAQGKSGINADAGLEAEADAVAARVMRGEPAGLGLAGGSAAAGGGGTRGPVQRRTYKALSDSQQSQVDAVAENVYLEKAQTFETRVGVAAAADARGGAAATNILQQLAVQFPAHAPALNAQLAAPVATKAAFIANIINAPIGARVTGTQSEQQNQTFDIQPGLEPTATHVVDPTGAAPPAVKNQVNQVNVATLDGGGAIRQDSAYANTARNDHILVRGTGSTQASHLFSAAQATATNLGNTKVLALGWLLGLGAHTFHEIMLAARDAGQNYTPGPRGQGYADIAPLTQADIGLHFPGFFFEPDFLILLARALFPDNPAERNDAINTMPADVRAHLAPIIQRFRGVRSDAQIANLLGAGLARSLVEKLNDNAFNLLNTFVAFGTIAGMTWAQVQAHGAYTAVVNSSGAQDAELIFGHLYDRQNPGGGARFVARAQGAIADVAAASPNGNIGFAPADHLQVNQDANAVFNNYGAHDRGVNLGATAAPLAGLTNNERTSINEYTSNNFATWHQLMGGDATTPLAALGAMGGDGARDNATQQIVAARGGLSQLPVYAGSAYRGGGGVATQGAATQWLQQMSPGTMYAPHIFLSASKAIGDSFIAPTTVAMVIDDVKTGHDIQLVSQLPREREVLFEPSARFVVTRIENHLTPVNPNPLNPAHAYTGGNLRVYMREISPQKDLFAAAARDAAFDAAEERNRDGRRLVDTNMFREAYAGYMTEQRPLARPENRFEHHGAYNALAANQVLASTQFDDWKAADNYMRARIGAALSGPDIVQMHTHASQNLPGAHPGQLRGAGQDVLASGGVGANGEWMAVDNAELAALQANARLNVGQVDAYPVPAAAQAAGKTHTCRVVYVLGAALGAAINGWHGQYVTRFNQILAMAPGAPRTQAAVQFAARAQRDFISLHPFRDGNGRTSRLIMDHILLSFGLTESIVADPNQDIMSGQAQWEGMVAAGVNQQQTWHRYYQG
jgi:hypothetical protein